MSRKYQFEGIICGARHQADHFDSRIFKHCSKPWYCSCQPVFSERHLVRWSGSFSKSLAKQGFEVSYSMAYTFGGLNYMFFSLLM